MKGRGGGCGTLRFFCSGPSTHDTFPMGGCEYCHCAVTMYRAQFAAHSAYDLLFSMHPRRYPKFARVLLWLLLEVAIVGEEGLREGGREGGEGEHGGGPSAIPSAPARRRHFPTLPSATLPPPSSVARCRHPGDYRLRHRPLHPVGWRPPPVAGMHLHLDHRLPAAAARQIRIQVNNRGAAECVSIPATPPFSSGRDASASGSRPFPNQAL